MALFMRTACPGCGGDVFGGWIVGTGTQTIDGCDIVRGYCLECYKNLPEGAWLKAQDEVKQ